jgi:hypothetical protein
MCFEAMPVAEFVAQGFEAMFQHSGESSRCRLM